jgi:hypothetical protein
LSGVGQDAGGASGDIARRNVCRLSTGNALSSTAPALATSSPKIARPTTRSASPTISALASTLQPFRVARSQRPATAAASSAISSAYAAICRRVNNGWTRRRCRRQSSPSLVSSPQPNDCAICW